MQLFRRKIICIVCIAQNNYAPFSKNRREIFTIQKKNRSAAISFEKSFSINGLEGFSILFEHFLNIENPENILNKTDF
jgi:hypothetical protein